MALPEVALESLPLTEMDGVIWAKETAAKAITITKDANVIRICV